MTPDELNLLERAGRAVLEDIAVDVSRAVLYGVYFIPSTVAMLYLWHRGLKTYSTAIPFLALVVVFIVFTAEFMSITIITAGLLRNVLVSHTDLSLKGRVQLANAVVAPWLIVEMWLSGAGQGVLFWIGDAVVVWRACVMFPHHKKIKLALISFFLAGVALAISSLVLETIDLPLDRLVDNGSAIAVLLLLNNIYFILLNATSTALIAWQTYKHRQLLKASFGQSRSKVANIMVLLTESGISYCGIQVISLCLRTNVSSSSSVSVFAAQIWDAVAMFASAIYPVAVILIVNHKSSIADTPGITEMLSNAGQNMDFARSPTTGDATGTILVSSHVEAGKTEEPGKQSRGGSEPSLANDGRWVSKSCP